MTSAGVYGVGHSFGFGVCPVCDNDIGPCRSENLAAAAPDAVASAGDKRCHPREVKQLRDSVSGRHG